MKLGTHRYRHGNRPPSWILKWSPLLYNVEYLRIYLQQVNQHWHTYIVYRIHIITLYDTMDSYEIDIDMIPGRHLEF